MKKKKTKEMFSDTTDKVLIYPSIVLFDIAYIILVIIMFIISIYLPMKMPSNFSMISHIVAIVLACTIVCLRFEKKHQRVFNKREYKRILWGGLISIMIMQVLFLTFYVLVMLDLLHLYPDISKYDRFAAMLNNTPVTVLITIYIFVFLFAFLVSWLFISLGLRRGVKVMYNNFVKRNQLT